MAFDVEESSIAWTNFTVNFWVGCKKVSDGCRNCYMHRNLDKPSSNFNPQEVTCTSKNYWDGLVKLNNISEKKIIFTCSWSDFFIEEADPWRAAAWKIIKATSQHEWLILTKRPERIAECLPDDWGEEGYANVWLGVSVENEKYLERVNILNNLKSEKSKFLTFISAEPLIGDIDFVNKCSSFSKTDWIIIGGESGNQKGKHKYRSCKLSWIDSIIQQGKDNGIPIFVKQMGTYIARKLNFRYDRYAGEDMRDWSSRYRIREYPTRYKGKTF